MSLHPSQFPSRSWLRSWLQRCCLVPACAVAVAGGCSEHAPATAGQAQDAAVDVPPLMAAVPPEKDAGASGERDPDVVYVPTPQPVVDAMLELAEVKPGEVLYDLGSGDGRIPITAARRYGVRAVGIDIDPDRIREARANAKNAGVTDKVSFRQADLFEEDFSEADVVTLYLLESLNVRLRPRLQAELGPGTRIVSHAFGMGDWPAEKMQQIGSNTIYLWTIPERKDTE